MTRIAFVLCVLMALGTGILWVAESYRPGGQAQVAPAAPAAPASVPLELRGNLSVSAWVGDAPAQEDLVRQLREWLPASEVALRGDVAVVRWRESIAAEKRSPAGWAILPLSQLRALVAIEEPDPASVSTVMIDLRANPRSRIVSLDDRCLLQVPPAGETPTQIAGDLDIDPFDPAITGLGSAVDGHRHVGDDSGVALLPPGAAGFEAMQALPLEVQWLQSLPEETIGPGAVFLARSSSARVYKVRIDDLEKHGRRMRLSFARIRNP